ncbi:MAG: serine hydrolase domain-containing protein, partial [Sphingosinicella sp.]|uniref:serine hydrolase domain-containing protein n=1 Tax=Sphingosinicella sp. TaxID=1917971 RepID=UPI004037AFD9
MSPRRLLTFLIAGLLGLGLLWAASLWLTAPLPEPAPGGDGVETAIVEASAEPASRVDYNQLDARLTRLMEDPAMVGLAVAVVEQGHIRFIKGYGETAEGTGDPVTTRTVFRWASLSKGVAGDMIALLASEGGLALHDPVNRWASSLRLPGGNEARATVADLLSHRLGLFAHAQDAKLEDDFDPRWLRGSLGTLHNICAPGTCHAYQNVAF